MSNVFTQPFSITWRKALLSAPRLVPDQVLYYTSPEGPHPVIINLPSRGKHVIPCYVFIPPAVTASSSTTSTPSSGQSSAAEDSSTQASNSPAAMARPKAQRTRSAIARLGQKSQPQPQPQSASQPATTLPVLLDFHGGGFVFGSCQEQAPFCAKMSRDLSALVISVDYRLGPAAQFPAAVEDAEDVLCAVLDAASPAGAKLRGKVNEEVARRASSGSAVRGGSVGIDVGRVAVSGFSSGGNLALNLGLSLPLSKGDGTVLPVEKAWPSVLPRKVGDGRVGVPLLLFFPSLDCRLLPSERPRPVGMEEKKGFLKGVSLETDLMPTYLPRGMAGHLRASPGLASLGPTPTSPSSTTTPNDTSSDENSSTTTTTTTTPRDGLHPQAKMLLVLPELDTLASQSETWIEKVRAEGRGEDLEVERVRGVTHGWCQFPDGFLSAEHRKAKVDVFERAAEFVRGAWGLDVGGRVSGSGSGSGSGAEKGVNG